LLCLIGEGGFSRGKGASAAGPVRVPPICEELVALQKHGVLSLCHRVDTKATRGCVAVVRRWHLLWTLCWYYSNLREAPLARHLPALL
jgi:hypothetical protein